MQVYSGVRVNGPAWAFCIIRPRKERQLGAKEPQRSSVCSATSPVSTSMGVTRTLLEEKHLQSSFSCGPEDL